MSRGPAELFVVAFPKAPAEDLIAQLERPGALHAQGLLSDAELAAAKSSLLLSVVPSRAHGCDALLE